MFLKFSYTPISLLKENILKFTRPAHSKERFLMPQSRRNKIPHEHDILASIRNIENNILERNECSIIKTLLYGNHNLYEAQNTDILNAIIKYLLSFIRFETNLKKSRKSIKITCLDLIHFEPERN